MGNNLREEISKLFIKWGLPTRQIVINELIDLVKVKSKHFTYMLIQPENPDWEKSLDERLETSEFGYEADAKAIKELVIEMRNEVKADELSKRLHYLVYCPKCNDAVERKGSISENAYECFGCQIVYELKEK